jgi:hypothetical protein
MPAVAADLPPEVRAFIARHIDSASLLDALLLLRAAPEKAWSAAEVARALVTTESLAADQLNKLLASGLVVEQGDGVRFRPGADGSTVDELAECYAKRRHTVVGAIYGSDVRSATTLSDAFRIRRRKD